MGRRLYSTTVDVPMQIGHLGMLRMDTLLLRHVAPPQLQYFHAAKKMF